MTRSNHSRISGSNGDPLAGTSPPPLAAGTGTPPSAQAPPRVSRPERLRQYEQRNRRIRAVNRWRSEVVALIPELRRTHQPIQGRNIAEALEVAIEDVCQRMSPLSPQEMQDPGNEAYSLPRLTDDVVLAVDGRIAAIVFASPDGPEVMRLGAFGGVEALIDAANGRSARKRYRQAGAVDIEGR
jgi:hypothetical protein